MKCPNVRECVSQQVIWHTNPFVKSSKCSLTLTELFACHENHLIWHSTKTNNSECKLKQQLQKEQIASLNT